MISKVQYAGQLRRAEVAAGVESISVRSDNAIDICIVYPESDEQKEAWKKEIVAETGDSTLVLEDTWGGTTVGLTFEEANLGPHVIKILKGRGAVRLIQLQLRRNPTRTAAGMAKVRLRTHFRTK
jgi:mannose/fructose-specific phosphotransferase system component IIA